MTFSVKSPAVILSVLGVIALLVGVIVFMQYMNQPQETTTKASVPGGTAEVAFKQPALSIRPGENGTSTVTFNTKGSRISAVGVRLTYTYTGNTAPLTVDPTDIKLNPVLVNWSCPTSTFIPGSGTATLEFGCVIVQGYSNSVPTDLFSFKLKADSAATAQVSTFSFASAQTTIFDKTTGEDVAAIPRGTLAVTINAATTTPTPTPSATPTPTPSARPTPTPSATPALVSCNGDCVANRDCATNLTCMAGKCRDSRCSSDTSCTCVTKTSTASALPVSGFDQTLTMFMLGMLFLLGGGQLLYTFAWRTQEEYVEEEV
jgi:hypothetical protein